MNSPTNILQSFCEAAARDVLDVIQYRAPVTLIAFYNNGSSEGCGFVSTLPAFDDLIATLSAVVTRWCGAPAPMHEVADWLPNDQERQRLAELVRDRLPLAAAFSLVIGTGPAHAHASFFAKEDLLPFFHEQLIPHLKARQVVAPQPESA